MKALILKKYGNSTGRRFAAVDVENFGRIDVLIRGPKDGATTNDFGDYHPTEETRVKPIKEKAEFLLKQRHAMNLKRNPRKRTAKKKTVRKNPAGTMQAMVKRDLNRYKKAGYLMTAAKRQVKALRPGKDWARIVDTVAASMLWAAPKRKVTMRKTPAVVDHFITSTKRKRDAGDTKETKMVWLWEGVGWTTDKNKAARYHDPNQANKIALLIVDNPKLHNANRRQLAVTPDTSHPK